MAIPVKLHVRLAWHSTDVFIWQLPESFSSQHGEGHFSITTEIGILNCEFLKSDSKGFRRTFFAAKAKIVLFASL